MSAPAQQTMQLKPRIMGGLEKWAHENKVVVVQLQTTLQSHVSLATLRHKRPSRDWKYQGEGVFFGYQKDAGMGRSKAAEVRSDFESQFDLEFESIMEGRGL
ncbi:MAG: hypothetical protein Q9218_001677 [Villophora microphyllina]